MAERKTVEYVILAGLVRKIDRDARVASLEDPAGLDGLAPLFTA